MSILRRLSYGIFPIASRRHQRRDDYSQFHRFSHMWTHDESITVIVIWCATPFVALLGPLFGTYEYGSSLLLMIFLSLLITLGIKLS